MSLSVTRRTASDAGRGRADSPAAWPRAPLRARASKPAGQLVGAGSTFVQPLVSQWQAAYPIGLGRQHRLPADRLGRRDPGDHQPHRRLRCLRRAPDAGPAHSVQGVPADSVGARRYFGDGEREDERERAAAHHRPGAGEDLPRADHELGRPGDQGAQPKASRFRARRSPRSTAPTGLARRTTSSDYLSSVSPAFKSKVGISTQPPFPVGRRR